jgi:thymidine phosphorylase
VFDVKTGGGATLPGPGAAEELAGLLVSTCDALGQPATALLTDMSQPLGRWVGHTAEIRETLEALAGAGPPDLMEVTFALAAAAAPLVGEVLTRAQLDSAIASGRAREAFDRWAAAQGAEPGWLARPDLALAPEEAVLQAPRPGVLAAVDCRLLGLLMVEAGAGRAAPGAPIDAGVSLRVRARLGDRVEAGSELARLHLRRRDERLERRFLSCFEIADQGVSVPPLGSAGLALPFRIG